MLKRILLNLFLLASCANAQTPPAPSAQKSPVPQQPPPLYQRIEVTATRLPEDPAQVPTGIEVFTGEELRMRGYWDLRSALSLAIGVEVAPGGDGGPASSVPDFWGLKEFDAFLLVVDGVPWGGAFNPALTSLDLNDLERIEVLRGPAPVTYGATSFVGAIHVVHRDPTSKDKSITLYGGSFGSGGVTMAVPLPCEAAGPRDSPLVRSAKVFATTGRRTAAVTACGAWTAETAGRSACGSTWTSTGWIRIRPARDRARGRSFLSMFR